MTFKNSKSKKIKVLTCILVVFAIMLVPGMAFATSFDTSNTGSSNPEFGNSDTSGFDPRDVDVSGFDPRDVDVSGFDPRDVDVSGFDPRDVDVSGFDPRDVDSNKSNSLSKSLDPDMTVEEFERYVLEVTPRELDEKGALGVKEEYQDTPTRELGVSAPDWEVSAEYRPEPVEREYREIGEPSGTTELLPDPHDYLKEEMSERYERFKDMSWDERCSRLSVDADTCGELAFDDIVGRFMPFDPGIGPAIRDTFPIDISHSPLHHMLIPDDIGIYPGPGEVGGCFVCGRLDCPGH